MIETESAADIRLAEHALNPGGRPNLATFVQLPAKFIGARGRECDAEQFVQVIQIATLQIKADVNSLKLCNIGN